jgi:hypothetical protein
MICDRFSGSMPSCGILGDLYFSPLTLGKLPTLNNIYTAYITFLCQSFKFNSSRITLTFAKSTRKVGSVGVSSITKCRHKLTYSSIKITLCAH